MEVSVSPPYTHASMAVPPLEKDMPKGSSASPAAIPTKPQDADAVKKKDVLETEQGRAVVPSRYIVRMVGSIVLNSTHDTPIHDLSPFRVGKMRLSFSDTLEDAPYAVPLMDRATFLSRAKELLHSDWDRELDPEIMPPGIPDYFLECEDDAKPARPAYCWGLLFHWAYLEFSQRSIYFFRNCLESINHQNPDMMWEETPVTRATELSFGNRWEEQLYMGERDEKHGDLIWKAFGGFRLELALDGVFMSSRMMDGFDAENGRNVVSKAELYVLLLHIGCTIEAYEDLGWHTEKDIPPTMVVNFTDKYARVIQGALVRPIHDPSIVELRISVSDSLNYLDDDGNVIPDVWLQLLHWTFSHPVGAQKVPVDIRNAPATAPNQESVKLVVPKARVEKTGDAQGSSEDEALRQASKSTTASSTARKKERQTIVRPSRLPRRTYAYSSDPATSSGSSSD